MHHDPAPYNAPETTPWGEPLDSWEVAPGIHGYGTATASGLWVHPQLYAAMPERYRLLSPTRDNWFEQANGHIAVRLAFPDAFDGVSGAALDALYDRTLRLTPTGIERQPTTSPELIADTIETLTSRDPDLCNAVLTMPEASTELADTVRWLAQQPPDRDTLVLLADIAMIQSEIAADNRNRRLDLLAGLDSDRTERLVADAAFDPVVKPAAAEVGTLIGDLARQPPTSAIALALGSIALTEQREATHHAAQHYLAKGYAGDCAPYFEYAGLLRRGADPDRRHAATTRFVAQTYSAAPVTDATAAPDRDRDR